MNLINKKLLAQKIMSFEFPTGEKLELSKRLLDGWQKALKDSDLDKTKEKSVQGKFLVTFFENILGYQDVTTGDAEWTLIQHPRIENDSKEPDGSLGFFTKDQKLTRAVIELKDARAQLDKKQNRGTEKLTPIEQAYLYATKYNGCNWIIVSNFREIRLYNKHKTQDSYEKFDVVDLTTDAEFKRFYFLLSKENLIAQDQESLIDQLAKDTTAAEQDITKLFYNEYKKVRFSLFQHFLEYNAVIEKDVLLEKAQKLLDRFVFTLFCEDTSGLLPLNIVRNTYERATNSLSPSDERVWSEFRGLFTAIDKGNDRVKPPINAYNGGLFAYDEILDALHIKDNAWLELMGLANYDFETDLNVNILGHIFEQSISDLEALKSELNGEVQDKKKSKRKKDGIFYTPEYITRYIVENTVGKYLEEHPDKLESIKILDPACGSGAFLNQAHSFLLKEYKNRYEAKITAKTNWENISIFDYNPTENNRNILLNNLYGVDLNQESVEISKLSLWLKTAKATEPLQNLDRNIKCGNSLIDDPEVAGDKAFDWNVEYKDIIADGGFDVIIGNPPYVGQKGNADVFKPFQHGKWEWFYERKQDLYYYFIALSIQLLKPNGYLGVIVPQYWLTAFAAKNLRKLLSEQCDLVSIVDLSKSKVFDDANINSSIFIFKKTKSNSTIQIEEQIDLVQSNKYISIINNSELTEDSWSVFKTNTYIDLWRGKNVISLGEIGKLSPGIQTGLDKSGGKGVFVLSDLEYKDIGFTESSRQHIKPLYKNSEIDNYYVPDENRFWIIITNHINNLSDYSDIEKHLDPYKSAIQNRFVNFALKNAFEKGLWWYLYGYRPQTDFEGKKIIFPYRASHPIFAYTNKPFYSCMDIYFITDLNSDFHYEYVEAALNSSVINYYLETNCKKKGNIIEFSMAPMNKVPIIKATNAEQLPICDLAISIKRVLNDQKSVTKDICSFIENEYSIALEHTAKNILNLGWNELTALINSKNAKVSIEKKEEIFTWFKNKQRDIVELQTQIDRYNKQIDQEFYKLYKLNQDEIATIEQSIIFK